MCLAKITAHFIFYSFVYVGITTISQVLADYECLSISN